MFDIQPKIIRHEKKQKMITCTEGRKIIKKNPEMTKTIELGDKNIMHTSCDYIARAQDASGKAKYVK